MPKHSIGCGKQRRGTDIGRNGVHATDGYRLFAALQHLNASYNAFDIEDGQLRKMDLSHIDAELADQVIAALEADRGAVMDLVNSSLLGQPGIHVVTWLAVAPDRTRVVRIGTSDAAAFPINGFDLIADTDPWCRRILGEKRALVCNSAETLFEFLPDEAQALMDMGHGASTSVPIVIGGSTRGTINVLGDAGALSTEFMALVRSLLPVAALIFAFADDAGSPERP